MAEELELQEKKDTGISLVRTLDFYNDDGKPGRKGWWEEAVGEARLNALRNAFMIGASDREACYLAGIPIDALYRYCRRNPEFSEEKERLKLNTVIKARQIILKAMMKSPELAWRYLAKKLPEEFGENKGDNIVINNGNMQQNILTPEYFQLREGDNIDELLSEDAEHKPTEE